MNPRREPTLFVALTTLGCTPGPAADDEADSSSAESTGDGGEASFELVSATMTQTGELVTLRFSEPVGSLEDVDPRDFRISVALPYGLCSDGDCVDKTGYWDANFYVDYYLTYAPYGPPASDRFEVDLLMPGDMPTDVVLHFALPLDPVLCEYFEGYDDPLHVHFAPGPIPLRSADGEPLAAIGPQWVDYVGPIPFMGVDGEFPNLDPRISIPCP